MTNVLSFSNWRLAPTKVVMGALLLSAVAGYAQEVSKPSAAPEMRVLQTRRVPLGNRSIIFNRVQPPVIAEKPQAPAPVALKPTEEERRVMEESAKSYARKRHESLFLTATVVDGPVTELYWTYSGRQCRAFSNIDFNYFAGMAEFETEDTVCWLLMAVVSNQSAGVQSGDTAKNVAAMGGAKLPPLPEFSKTRSEYFVVEDQGGPLPDEAVVGIEALHVYFDANRARIIEESKKREAARIAQEQWLKEHPPVPKNTVINFWPIKSRVYGDAPKAGGAK